MPADGGDAVSHPRPANRPEVKLQCDQQERV